MAICEDNQNIQLYPVRKKVCDSCCLKGISECEEGIKDYDFVDESFVGNFGDVNKQKNVHDTGDGINYFSKYICRYMS